jgi:hypothetical protein
MFPPDKKPEVKTRDVKEDSSCVANGQEDGSSERYLGE